MYMYKQRAQMKSCPAFTLIVITCLLKYYKMSKYLRNLSWILEKSNYAEFDKNTSYIPYLSFFIFINIVLKSQWEIMTSNDADGVCSGYQIALVEYVCLNKVVLLHHRSFCISEVTFTGVRVRYDSFSSRLCFLSHHCAALVCIYTIIPIYSRCIYVLPPPSCTNGCRCGFPQFKVKKYIGDYFCAQYLTSFKI